MSATPDTAIGSVHTGDEPGIREIDTGAPPTRFARGWHCLGLVEEFDDGQPHSIHIFGTKLVVWVTRAGGDEVKVNVLDAYCRHMGGDLSQGSIKDDGNVACPFHGWLWKGNGRCAGVPYAKRNPKLAKTRSWPTMIRNAQVFVYNDPEGDPPPEDCIIPALDEVGSSEWTGWTWNRIVIEGANCREIIDNVVDMAHFYYVHFALPDYFKNVFEGETAAQYMNSHGRPDVTLGTNYGDSRLESIAAYYGPSYMLNPMIQYYGGYAVETILTNCHYPIDANSFVLMYGVMAKVPEGLTAEQADKMAKKISAGVEVGFLQDVEIWKHKTRIDNPLLVEEDGPVYQLRRWYEQFYVDKADVSEEMTGRFEYEIDTEKALESWGVEIEENLRLQREAKDAENASEAADSTGTSEKAEV
ncbi:Rieske (2Fe-2S) iron-sulphur domain protein [Gordonia bronchialis DSM 43247]|uniref:Rieske-type oxygenase n=1 Tax=Gordonia bronchialis (strain ATCC 25592 / DSM 43247 / BCRC 13721 / JCM 3198 / KCTC 3076 / NBRC 16047 / NCTC 10667) TaxID=526226 RepID=D0L3N2_GORB4|nr:Rieske 2Fe-2S domain-containing protein [Gordonia bronchialis]ACY20231.1 Rieske (2Fe-2S) iron-sulphur domain protein [Gordonia bronchialis DSM 43247]MCC3323004.1 aromatic ring-hydroxylating dioxygenase subunit alpha [Gordonia bronchialis]QGS25947.1 Rieske 2Fe-2S domain-containing protein [Gordonia bronchialis]STQ63032.1 3-ketosteroid-9-alpha-hydroxylase oxygenase subunit [Gordonia bronchialis]